MIQGIFDRVREFIFTSAVVVAGRVRTTTNRWTASRFIPKKDWSRPKYEYWRRAYACQVQGLEIAGLFIRPIVNKIVAWSLGRSPNFQCKTATAQKALEEWWDFWHAVFLMAYRTSLKLGDAFFVINSDLTVTILPPEAVFPIVDPLDYGKIIGWRVLLVFPHPDDHAQKITVTDEYYADRRVHIEEQTNGVRRTQIFPNLIGEIPVIHIANQPDDSNIFGHPEAEALIKLFQRYEQTLEAAIEGNILQGRPTPVLSFKTIQDLNAFWRRYGKQETFTQADGTKSVEDTLSLDLSEVMTVSGADFKYAAPGAFTEDTERLLGLLFYLILEHTELPEFVFGNAISSSKASAETQMPIFEIFIRMRQKDSLGWILRTAKVYLSYLSVLRPGIRAEEPTLQWPKLTQNGRLTLEAVSWGYGEGLLDDRTALMLLPLDVERPDEILRKAKRDAEKRRQRQLEDQRQQLTLQAEFSEDDEESEEREIEMANRESNKLILGGRTNGRH